MTEWQIREARLQKETVTGINEERGRQIYGKYYDPQQEKLKQKVAAGIQKEARRQPVKGISTEKGKSIYGKSFVPPPK